MVDAGAATVTLNRPDRPEFLAKLTSLDFDAVAPNSPVEFGRFLASQLAVWRDLGSRIKIEIQYSLRPAIGSILVARKARAIFPAG